MSDTKALVVEHLTKRYDAHHGIFDINLTVSHGEVFGSDLTQKARETAKNYATIAPSAQQYLNEELENIDVQIKHLSLEKTNLETKKPIEIDKVIARTKYFVENLDKLIIKQIDPIKKAQFFGLIFKTLPTYEDLVGRNQKSPLFTGGESGASSNKW